MDIVSLMVSHNSLKMQMQYNSIESKNSPKIKIQFIECQLKWSLNNDENICYLLINLKKCVDDDILYISKVNSEELKIKKTFIIDGHDWHLLRFHPTVIASETTEKINIVNIEIIIDTKDSSPLGLFFEDNSMTDFEIKGTDGSIRVHKVILATASEVFRKMVTNDFKEKKEAQVELPYPKCVLQDLKDYIYLNTLNDDNLESLLMLAHCYMMCELKQKCIVRLYSNTMTEKTLVTNRLIQRKNNSREESGLNLS